MTVRQPPPSPAAVRLTREAAVIDLTMANLDPCPTDQAQSQMHAHAARLVTQIGPRTPPPGLARAVLEGRENDRAERHMRRFGGPMLPHTPEQIARMLLEARDQLGEPASPDEPPQGGRGRSTSPGGWCNADGGADILPLLAHHDPRREVLPEYRAFVHYGIAVLNP